MVAECVARGRLNSFIRSAAEQLFGAPMTLSTSPGQPRLTSALASLVRQECIRRALGHAPTGFPKRLVYDNNEISDPATSNYLTVGLPRSAVETVQRLMDRTSDSEELRVAAESFRQLAEAGDQARNLVEGHLLRHQLPGKCNWCRDQG